MPTSPLNTVIQHLMADCRLDGGMTDGELLARFLGSRDYNALAALVRRHAAMVWGVCCRLLRSHHDAEDAFQATFLVLVRKAADVPRQAVANWLYGVARQTAVRLRTAAAKHGRRQKQVVTMPEPTAAEARDPDLPSVVDDELSHLPDHYRAVIILCDLQGMTRKEAARQLAIPEGSVGSRLARGRVLLAKRLTRRGIVLAGGMLAASLAAGSASASAPPALVASAVKAASLLAAGRAAGVISAKVAALAEGVVKAMLVTKIMNVLAVVLVVATLGGAAVMIYRTEAAELTPGDLPTARTASEKGDKGEPAKADADDASSKVQRLQKQLKRLRADNEELKKRLQQAVRKGKADDTKLMVKVYPVLPLLVRELEPDDQELMEAQQLIRAITRTIEPTSWEAMGGEGSVQYVGSAASIVVRQTPDNQKQVQELLDALRKNKTEQRKAELEEREKAAR
jgi:RNA polymerase sigma factor (sigma-70 family)